MVASHTAIHKEEEQQIVKQAQKKAAAQQAQNNTTMGDVNSELQALKDKMEGKNNPEIFLIFKPP